MLDLQSNLLTWVKDQTFLEGLIIGMQAVTDEDGNLVEVDTSECLA